MNANLSDENQLVNLLALFKENQELLERIGWFPTEAQSPKWWGGLGSADEIVISALLVQQQTWESVKRVIENMKNKGYSSLDSLSTLSIEDIELLIAGSNFYKTKARRLLSIAKATNNFGGLDKILSIENRQQLLSLEGIGEETADSTLLFAGNQLTLPISVYVRRVLERVLNRKLSIKEVRSLFQGSLPQDLYSYKLFYAGLSTVGNVFCRSENPNCAQCILSGVCSFARVGLEE